ncbi:MAG: site-2 protease family protein [Candidatus Calescibacterium sp.]|nr:site-2 protease family protein [Candidatus Calescibacterium sp.]MDW8086978.1 site-2 protease family protein [Candidatus Calescibacterium sp.]
MPKNIAKIGRFRLILHKANFYIVELEKNYWHQEVLGLEFRPSVRWEMKITLTHIVLFFLTFLTTTAAGAMMQGYSPISRDLIKGVVFSAPLLFILVAHEMGHIFALWKYGIRSSFPYFIPAPNIIGTFGAIMVLRERIAESSKILKVGAAGPIAGFIAAIPVAIIGLKISSVVAPDQASGEGMIKLGSPLIFSIMEKLFAEGKEGEILLHPVAFAGWIGFFVTSMNLIPVGQTDGGHIVFSLFPSLHRLLSFVVSFVLLVIGFLFWYGWIIWGVLTLLLGIRASPYIPQRDIGSKEKFIAFLSLLIFVLSFILVPIQV